VRPFQVIQPASVEEASRALRDYGEAARIYAGGTELLWLLRQRLVFCDYLVDVKRIPDLKQFEWNGGLLTFGAGITHRQAEQSPLVRDRLAALAQVEALVANVRVRNVGTIGGNLCFNDPHSDPGTLLIALDAQVELQRDRTKRQLPLEQFWTSSYETVLEPDELLVSVSVPALPSGAGVAYERLERLERPTAGVAAVAAFHDGRLHDVRLSVGCVGPQPMRLHPLEGRLEGATPEEGGRIVRSAQSEVADTLQPVDDIHGSVEYKSYIVPVLLARALSRAVAQQSSNH
jgi:aerobic carbon-monoxide dehydrogenase medium subunit